MPPLISIIVPTYNVADYVADTLCSLVKQSFPEFEVIVVDDGSLDSTYEVCESFANGDSRFLLVRQPNMGVSVARNVGVERAKGAYLTFIDGDDVVSPYYLEVLMNGIKAGRADACAVGLRRFYGNEAPSVWDDFNFDKVLLLEGDKILAEMLYGKRIDDAPCGIIFSRDAWGDLAFPVGSQYEDLYLMPDFYARCNRVLVVQSSLYGYRQRRGSAMNPERVSQKRLFDYRFAIEHVRRYTECGKPDVERAANARVCLESLRMLLLLGCSDCSAEMVAQLEGWLHESIHETYLAVMHDRSCPAGVKSKLTVLRYAPFLVKPMKVFRQTMKEKL